MLRFLKLVLGLFMAAGFSGQARAFDLFVTGEINGVALYGYDPVAYFDKQEAVMGKNELEARWCGAYWKFDNEANRDRFLEAPEVYAPMYNGYGAYSVSKGRLAEGNPMIWAIYKNRLVLFHSVEMRSEWLQNPPKFIQAGDENWESLKKTLTR